MVTGHLLGTLTDWIVEFGDEMGLMPNLKSFCIGHSLGSHVCGFTGKARKLTGIIGLDPAGPIFDGPSQNSNLRLILLLNGTGPS